MMVHRVQRLRISAFLMAVFAIFWFTPVVHSNPLPVKCGTVAALQANRDAASMRPLLPEERISDSGRFKVHYTTSGNDAPAPGFVDSALAILDQMWTLQVDDLGFQAPPAEQDGFIHLYFLDLDGYYGSTHPLANSGTDIPSYMQCDNNFSESYYPTRGMNGLRVTLAHEFFHVIQFGYRVDMFEVAHYEWYSTWMEDVAYPEINDYVWYLDSYFEQPNASLLRVGDNREYAACLFVHYVYQQYGINTIRNIWNFYKSNPDANLFDLAVSEIVSSYDDPVGDKIPVAGLYAAYCYFTGSRALEQFGFKDAELFPEAEATTVSSGHISWNGALGTWGWQPFTLTTGILGGLEWTDPVPSSAPSLEPTHAYALGAVPEYHEWMSFIYRSSSSIESGLEIERGFFTVINLSDDAEAFTVDGRYAPMRSTGEPMLTKLYPNPTSGSLRMGLQVDAGSTVEVSVYNVLGRLVWREYQQAASAGLFSVLWDGRDTHGHLTPSGYYIVQARIGNRSDSKPFLRVLSK